MLHTKWLYTIKDATEKKMRLKQYSSCKFSGEKVIK